jgi:hypothetical protein
LIDVEEVAIVPKRSRNNTIWRPANIHKIDIAATTTMTITSVIRVFRMTATSGVATRLRRVHSKNARQHVAATGLREGRSLIYL